MFRAERRYRQITINGEAHCSEYHLRRNVQETCNSASLMRHRLYAVFERGEILETNLFIVAYI